MALTVVTTATNRNLVQLQTVKDQLGITDTSQDTVLTELIMMASDAVVQFCQRGFAQQVYSETLAAYNSIYLMVSQTPLLAVTSVTYNGAPIDATTYDIENPAAGLILSAVPWFWTAELGIDVGQNILPNSEIRRYTVAYTAGYNLPGDATQTNPLPSDVSFATTDTVRNWWLGRQREEDVYQRRVGDLLLSYQSRVTPPGLTRRAETLLQRWVRIA